MAIDKRQRYIMDFITVGRSGKRFYVFGAPEDLKGPYTSTKEATKVYQAIVDNFEDYEVVERELKRKK